jgi:hypothetical protein
MKNKMNAGIVVAVVAAISTFGVIDALQATTEVYVEAFGPDAFQILSTTGHEIDVNDCPPPFPPPAGT